MYPGTDPVARVVSVTPVPACFEILAQTLRDQLKSGIPAISAGSPGEWKGIVAVDPPTSCVVSYSTAYLRVGVPCISKCTCSLFLFLAS